MPQRIIDMFKAIQINKQHCELFTMPRRHGDRLLDAINQQTAVWQAGQRVMVCTMLQALGGSAQFLLQPLALGNIPLHRNPVRKPAHLVAYRRNAELGPKNCPILIIVQNLDTHWLPSVERLAYLIENQPRSQRPLENARRFSDHFVRGISSHGGEGGIRINNPGSWHIPWLRLGYKNPIRGLDDNALEQPELCVRRRVQKCQKFGTQRNDLCFSQFACRDVGCDLHYLVRQPLRIQNWIIRGLQPNFPAVLAGSLEFAGLILALS